MFVQRPFQKVGFDLLGPFPVTFRGNRQIIVAVDIYLTKWVEVKAMPTGKALQVVEFFVEQIFLRHGAPEEIITDQGKCFSSETVREITKMLTTRQRTSSGYNPQCNG